MLVPADVETIPAQPETEVRKAIAETIEAPAQMSKAETLKEWHDGTGKYAGAKELAIEEAYRRTSLNGAKGQICSIAWAYDLHMAPLQIFATPGEVSEKELLTFFFADLRKELRGLPVQFAGHFIGGFDLTFIFQRAVILEVNPGINLGQHGWHGKDFFDTQTEWAGRKGTISLDNLCKALGIDVESPEGLEGSTVWDFYKAGKYAEIGLYNQSDVVRVQRVMRRIQFLP